MVGQQRQQISELQFDKIPNPQSLLVWKFRFKTQVRSQLTPCSDFPLEAMSWVKEVEMVGSLDELNYAGFFSVNHRDDNVQEFDTRWVEVPLSMSKIPPDDVLESLYKLRIK